MLEVRMPVFLISLIAFVVLLAPFPIHAQSTIRQEMKDKNDVWVTRAVEREKRSSERLQKLENHQATREARLSARKQKTRDNVVSHIRKLLDHAARALLRLDGVWQRALAIKQDRLAQGADTVSLKEKEDELAKNRQAVVDAIGKVTLMIDSIETSQQPREDSLLIRKEIIAVRKALIDYHQSITRFIRELRVMKRGVTITPTS